MRDEARCEVRDVVSPDAVVDPDPDVLAAYRVRPRPAVRSCVHDLEPATITPGLVEIAEPHLHQIPTGAAAARQTRVSVPTVRWDRVDREPRFVEVEVVGVPRTLAGTVLRGVVGPSRRWPVGTLAEGIDRRAGVRAGMNLEVEQRLGLELGAVGRRGDHGTARAPRGEEPEHAREADGPDMELDRPRISIVEPHVNAGDVVGDDPDPGNDRRERPEETDRRREMRPFVQVRVRLTTAELVVPAEHEHQLGTHRAMLPPLRVRARRRDRCLDAPGDAVDGAPRDELGWPCIDEVGLQSLVDDPRLIAIALDHAEP